MRSLGSGFVIDAAGYIITNAHLVADRPEISVRLADRREFEARVVGVDPVSDIALLKIEASGLPPVRIGDPAKLRPGEWVAAIGSPFGLERSVTAGIVSALGRTLPEESFVPFIQTDVAVNPGNSGGPLFNLRGEVVGVNSGFYSDTGGYAGVSFAIPIDVAMEVAAQLRAYGKVTRGRIGVRLQEVTVELARALKLPRASRRPRGRGVPAQRGGARRRAARRRHRALRRPAGRDRCRARAADRARDARARRWKSSCCASAPRWPCELTRRRGARRHAAGGGRAPTREPLGLQLAPLDRGSASACASRAACSSSARATRRSAPACCAAT